MLSDRPGKWVTGLVSLAIVTAVHAGPTPSMHQTDALIRSTHGSEAADVSPASASQITLIDGAHNASLASVADELLKPPADSPLSATSSLSPSATSLPPIPGALFMTLAGFLCVSLVRDRKVWTGALVGLLWAGQAGVTALPQLARHLAGRGHAEELYSPDLTCTPAPDDLDRLRSNIEGTHYVGLLHYLAGIPNTSLLRKQESKSTTHVRTPRSAIREVSAYILPVTKRLACIIKQHACFSPTFIFDSLARGPPLSAWERSLKR